MFEMGEMRFELHFELRFEWNEWRRWERVGCCVFEIWRGWCGELYWKGWELKGVDGVQMSG